MTKYLKVNNAAAQLGLGPFDNGTRDVYKRQGYR